MSKISQTIKSAEENIKSDDQSNKGTQAHEESTIIDVEPTQKPKSKRPVELNKD